MPNMKPTGGAAFASPPAALPNGNIEWGTTGMSLRSYFAAKALQGDWAAQNESQGQFSTDCNQAVLEARAALYYRMADAMVKAGAE